MSEGGRPNSSIKCLVVGCPRSGTTLLGVLLDRHSALAITPETAFYDEIAPPDVAGQPEELRRRLASSSRLVELGLRWQDVVAACAGEITPASLFAQTLSLYAQARGRPFAGEKTPQHWRHARRLLEDFPETTLIWMIRDGRDVVQSLVEAPWWRWGPEAAARTWAESSASAEATARRFPGRVVLVRYEALVDAPEQVLAEVMRALDLDFEPGQLDPAAPSAVVLERSMLWKGRALGPVDPTRQGRWRTASTQLLSAIEPILRPQLVRLAYLQGEAG